MRVLDRFTVDRFVVDKKDERVQRMAMDVYEEDARQEFVETLQAKALGTIWPSVVVTHSPDVPGVTRVRVRGYAYRCTM